MDSQREHTQSYYRASVKGLKNRPPLEEAISADVCIVGGGFSGVATALELAEKGLNVVLLEARRIGWGASGRNGGQLVRGLGHDLQRFTHQLGQDGVAALDAMGFEAIDIVRERVERYQIDCDLKWGYCDLADKPRHIRELEAEYQALKDKAYRHSITLLDKDALQAHVGSDKYLGGMLDMGSGHLQPLNLCLAEAALAEQNGARLFELSEVISLSGNGPYRVKTLTGSVKADKLVLCGNGYMGMLEPRIGAKVLPAGSYLLATAPLPKALWQQILPSDVAACDLNIALDYFRLSADKRLIFGGMCNYSGRDPKDIRAAMVPKMLKVFPALKGVNIDYAWAGMLGIGANRLPQIGELTPGFFYAQAYSGHGINASHLAARVIGEAISGKRDRFTLFNQINHRNFPGGPWLRPWLLATGMLYHRFKELL
ncbi:NAD(P)/FAD-dependent oxidoreductase [Gallaecimonas mangrovi]|uniref:NAD(P)/FAD-dependent oxidoreductase n=1 Tax=Gallaecimonas mangrovi TaxID=2291597 RepID=UPI000E208AB3|nr:FAD-binding oxidoreductase [Gallaecimonas mangrovi]